MRLAIKTHPKEFHQQPECNTELFTTPLETELEGGLLLIALQFLKYVNLHLVLPIVGANHATTQREVIAMNFYIGERYLKK